MNLLHVHCVVWNIVKERLDVTYIMFVWLWVCTVHV